jgi:hydrogenase maturation protease
MNLKLIDAIANAVLYEGYMLYPYRPSSVKNRQRFNFGVLYPKRYCEAQSASDAWTMQTECPLQSSFAEIAEVEIKVRFLKLVSRTSRDLPETLSVPWQEAIECEVVIPPQNLDALTSTPLEWKFAFPAKQETELLRDENGQLIGTIERNQESLQGIIEIQSTRAADDLFKLQVRVRNLTPFHSDANGASRNRDSALMQSLVSAHTLLGAVNAEFVSLLEPPDNLKDHAAGCENIGAWPVLVGDHGRRDTMLASPIILYDYPQIAPESPGDLFDGTEIDEILALRIMTMTDDEKREMRNTDDRARKILERTESLPMEHLAKLHGTLRELRSLKEEMP